MLASGQVIPSRCFALIVGCLVFVFLVGMEAAPESDAGVAPGSCPSEGKTRDYAAPLRAFPPIRNLPPSGTLPFGPAELRITSLSEDVQAGHGIVGFRVAIPISRQRHGLDWTVNFRVTQLSVRGSPKALIAEHRSRLSHAQEVGLIEKKLAVPVPSTPAFYRVDIAIEGANGATLGRYSEYVRVVPRRVKVKLLLRSDVFSPGELLFTRIKNQGTAVVFFELHDLTLEQRVQDGWRLVTLERSPRWGGSGSAVGSFIVGGQAGECSGIHLPSGLAPGIYRVSRTISTRLSRRFPLRARFHIL